MSEMLCIQPSPHLFDSTLSACCGLKLNQVVHKHSMRLMASGAWWWLFSVCCVHPSLGMKKGRE